MISDKVRDKIDLFIHKPPRCSYMYDYIISKLRIAMKWTVDFFSLRTFQKMVRRKQLFVLVLVF